MRPIFPSWLLLAEHTTAPGEGCCLSVCVPWAALLRRWPCAAAYHFCGTLMSYNTCYIACRVCCSACFWTLQVLMQAHMGTAISTSLCLANIDGNTAYTTAAACMFQVVTAQAQAATHSMPFWRGSAVRQWNSEHVCRNQTCWWAAVQLCSLLRGNCAGRLWGCSIRKDAV